MNCKKAVVVDENFIKALGEVSEIPMKKEVAYKYFRLMSNVHVVSRDVWKERSDLLESLAVKRNDGTPKVKHGNLVFKDNNAAKAEVINLLSEDVEVDNEGLSAEDITQLGLPPKYLQSLAIVSQVLEKEGE